MDEKVSQSERLFEEALDIVMRIQEDPDNSVSVELVNLWRARSPDHEVAWREALDIYQMTGKVMRDQRRATTSKISRRSLLTGGAAGLAIVAGGALLGPKLILRLQADYITQSAQLSDVSLPDGSRMTLGPDTAIRVHFSETERLIELLAGMAFFDVQSDSARPFSVQTGNLTATALGTAFDVSNDAGYLTVSVDHGLVAVRPSGVNDAPTPLGQGDWLTFNERSHDFERGNRDASQIAAWRKGVLVAERDTIASVVARIARWQSGRVLLAQSSFGAQRISGVFDLNNPVAALEAVVEPYGGRVRQVSPWLTIVSSI
ncbi:FecR domain-containing protein [Ochrobactrum sp. Marseille-Q0166]|uniref:FecR family protein n=1 Tax=Ochrobactrum sp. Marseille-Q0166 TaxID=2761105 RepID=UPI001655A590|nr:FecR domain-containing protein [Ochrobactrum sp. Marseille-Q0166]MBC8718739.1 FecR domain-containing protein [Ochrobactrum sp. Marseille-Q0166]